MRELLVGVAFLALAAYLIRKDHRVRSGVDRTWVANYRNPKIPVWLRTAPLVARYSAITLFSWGVASIVYWATASRVIPEFAGGVIIVGLAIVSTAAMVVALVGAYRVPERLKPEWLREEERRFPRPLSDSRIDRIADLAVVAIPLGFLAVAIVSGLLLFVITLLR